MGRVTSGGRNISDFPSQIITPLVRSDIEALATKNALRDMKKQRTQTGVKFVRKMLFDNGLPSGADAYMCYTDAYFLAYSK